MRPYLPYNWFLLRDPWNELPSMSKSRPYLQKIWYITINSDDDYNEDVIHDHVNSADDVNDMMLVMFANNVDNVKLAHK